jgi:hypothetical protein
MLNNISKKFGSTPYSTPLKAERMGNAQNYRALPYHE